MKHTRTETLIKLCLVIFVISSALFLGSGRCIDRPNLLASTMRSFDYTEYNNTIEQENINNNEDVNIGKVGYIVNNKDSYVLSLSIGAAEYVPIYLTKQQAIELKHLKDYNKPVLVKAKLVDDCYNSSDYYSIKILNMTDNTYGVSCIETERTKFLYAMIASALCIVLCLIKYFL